MADLLNKESVALIRSRILVSLAQKRVERFRNAANSRSIFGSSKGSDIEKSFGRVWPLCSRVEQIGVLHILCYTLQQRCGLVERHRKCHLGHILANHGFQDTLVNGQPVLAFAAPINLPIMRSLVCHQHPWQVSCADHPHNPQSQS